jgi:hypothetical protein
LHNDGKVLQGFESVCGIGEAFDFHDVFTLGKLTGLTVCAVDVYFKCFFKVSTLYKQQKPLYAR